MARSGPNTCTLPTIPEGDVIDTSQPDVIALLDVLQRFRRLPLKDALEALPQHLQLLQPMLEHLLEENQTSTATAVGSTWRGPSFFRLAFQASQRTPSWTELALHLVPTLAGMTGAALRQLLRLLPAFLPPEAFVPRSSMDASEDCTEAVHADLEADSLHFGPLGSSPAAEGWQDSTPDCEAVSELNFVAEEYQPSADAERLEKLLSQVASSRLEQHTDDRPIEDVDAAVELLEEGFGLKIGNFIQQQRLQQATSDSHRLHNSHSATLSQLDEVTQDCFIVRPCPAMTRPPPSFSIPMLAHLAGRGTRSLWSSS